MNNLQESILIKSDKKIEIMNTNFIDTFIHLIGQNLELFRNENFFKTDRVSINSKF